MGIVPSFPAYYSAGSPPARLEEEIEEGERHATHATHAIHANDPTLEIDDGVATVTYSTRRGEYTIRYDDGREVVTERADIALQLIGPIIEHGIPVSYRETMPSHAGNATVRRIRANFAPASVDIDVATLLIMMPCVSLRRSIRV